jgi:hypothetical protein
MRFARVGCERLGEGDFNLKERATLKIWRLRNCGVRWIKLETQTGKLPQIERRIGAKKDFFYPSEERIRNCIREARN